MAGFAILIVEGLNKIYQRVHAINFGIYGATQAGKTTMNHQLRTRGEVPDIRERTVGKGRATRKYVKLDGDAHTVKSADIGGQVTYWNDWIHDMRSRRVKYIIFMIDDIDGVSRTETMISLEESINDKKRLMHRIFNDL